MDISEVFLGLYTSYDYEDITAFWTGYACVWWGAVLIGGLICGFISQHINESKGYEGGFAWGFFLGVIGIIVVALKQDNRRRYYYDDRPLIQDSIVKEPIMKDRTENTILNSGQWRCGKCGEVNPMHTTTCICGNSRDNKFEDRKNVDNREDKGETLESSKTIPQVNTGNKNEDIISDNQIGDEYKRVELLKKYKELLDSGIITKEEFDKMKNDILG